MWPILLLEDQEMGARGGADDEDDGRGQWGPGSLSSIYTDDEEEEEEGSSSEAGKQKQEKKKGEKKKKISLIQKEIQEVAFDLPNQRVIEVDVIR